MSVPATPPQVLVLVVDPKRRRVTLSTKKLEPTRGDMLRTPQLVFEQAEQMVEKLRARARAVENSADISDEECE